MSPPSLAEFMPPPGTDTRNLFLGIDPGISGGIAILDRGGRVVVSDAMPKTERDIYELIDEFVVLTRFAFIERVGPMPKQGLSSTWKFAQSYGFLRGLLIAMKIPFEEVRPQAWQKALGCLSRGDKNRTKARAQQLWPSVRCTHAISDALLIAEHCRRLHRD